MHKLLILTYIQDIIISIFSTTYASVLYKFLQKLIDRIKN